VIVAKKAKNRAHITEEDMEVIDRITLACSAKIFYFLMTHHDPRRYARKILRFWKMKKTPFLPHLLFKMMSMDINDLFFPQELKIKAAKTISYEVEDVTNAILDLTKNSSTHLKSWAVTEALQDQVEEGFLSNVKGKKSSKEAAPKAFPKLKKGGGYINGKREGLYSGYMITRDLAALNRIVSKPEALEIIHHKLRKYGRLEDFFLFNGLAVIYAIMQGDKMMFKYYNTITQTIIDNSPAARAALSKAGLNSKKVQYSLWEPIKSYLRSIKEEELEGFVRNMIQAHLENPIDYSYTLLAISRS
jgi:hypothetical protein